MKAFVRNMKRPSHVSHRGGSAVAPENTLPAFRQAISRWNTDQLEMDVHMSKDGVVFVFHDDTVERTTDGHGAIADMTAAEVERLDAGYRFTNDGGQSFPFRGTGVQVPRLVEVLAATSVPIMMEIKDARPDVWRAVVKVIREAGASERLCVGAWRDAAALELANEFPDLALFYPEQAARLFVAAALQGQTPPESPFDVLALPVREGPLDLSAPPIVNAAHAAGKRIQLWTVDDEATMRSCIERGIDGVQTDRPDLLRLVMDARG